MNQPPSYWPDEGPSVPREDRASTSVAPPGAAPQPASITPFPAAAMQPPADDPLTTLAVELERTHGPRQLAHVPTHATWDIGPVTPTARRESVPPPPKRD